MIHHVRIQRELIREAVLGYNILRGEEIVNEGVRKNYKRNDSLEREERFSVHETEESGQSIGGEENVKRILDNSVGGTNARRDLSLKRVSEMETTTLCLRMHFIRNLLQDKV